MRILHTSDWHLGQYLINKDRSFEHQQFLDWLITYLKENPIDVLIIAGDVFDSGTPPNYALQLYYDFLRRIPDTQCNMVVIVGGNHDSVSTLHAPKELLKLINIHIIGGIGGIIDDEIITVTDNTGQPKGIICAVPFLRDRDIRKSMAGESYEDRSKAIQKGIIDFYKRIKEKAVELSQTLSMDGKLLPIIATGHLFAAGSVLTEGIRDIHIGGLGQVKAAFFPTEFNYIALGHLHRAQIVGKKDNIRYSGSPIPLSFSEAGDEKQLVQVDFENSSLEPHITKIPIPEFQKLICVKGDIDKLKQQIKKVTKYNDRNVWVEVQVDTEEWIPDIHAKIIDMTMDLPVDVLAVKNIRHPVSLQLQQTVEQETLQELMPFDVFEKRLALEGIFTAEDKENLVHTFNEVLENVNSIEGRMLNEN